jgi:general stress protein 26
MWLDDRLYFNTSPRTVTARNLEASPAVCVHLGSGEEVVIIEGHAAKLASNEVPVEALDEYGLKYGDPAYRPDPADPELPWYGVEPHRVLFWAEPDIRNAAVRWPF